LTNQLSQPFTPYPILTLFTVADCSGDILSALNKLSLLVV